MQSKLESFVEISTSVGIGYVVAVISQMVIFPLFGYDMPLSDNILIALWFTVISIIRSFIVRRWFNYRTMKKLKRKSWK